MLDKTCGLPIIGFERLKSKMHTFKTKNDHICKKAEYIHKNVDHSELRHEGYKNDLLDRLYMRHEMNRIQSQNHNIGT